MGGKRKSFTDWVDFQRYLTSAKERWIQLYARVSDTYPGIVEELVVLARESGKDLLVRRYFLSYGLDWMGDLCKQEAYLVRDLEQLRAFVEDEVGLPLDALRTTRILPDEMPSTEDTNRIPEYQEGWRRLEKDFDDGLLTFKGLKRADA